MVVGPMEEMTVGHKSIAHVIGDSLLLGDLEQMGELRRKW